LPRLAGLGADGGGMTTTGPLLCDGWEFRVVLRLGGDDAGTKDWTPSSSKVLTVPTVPWVAVPLNFFSASMTLRQNKLEYWSLTTTI
jgi:hypothetical protein